MLKTAYQIGVDAALKEAGIRQLLRGVKEIPQRWRESRALSKSLRLGAKDPIMEVPSRAGWGEGLRAMTAPGGVPQAAAAKGGVGEGVRALTEAAPAAAPGAAQGVPGWAKMLGLGGLGGGAYYAGTTAAPAAAAGGFLGATPDQGLQSLSPEIIRLLMQGQGPQPY